MKLKALWRTLVVIALLTCFAQATLANPEVFSSYTLDKAKEQARVQKKLLVVDFTASWCGPCKSMEGTTWVDPKVVKWIKENAIAIQLDVDKEPGAANSLKVNAMPTIVVFSSTDSSKEVDRQVGYKDGGELLSWLQSVRSGKTSIDILKEKSQSIIDKGGAPAVKARYQLAEELLEAGKFSDATEQFVWLWNNIQTECPSMIGVRGSFMAAKIAVLVKEYPAAKKQFSELRDKAKQSNELHDWIVLSDRVLDDKTSILNWFDSIKEDPKQKETLDKHGYLIQRTLEDNNRWSDVGKYWYKDPMANLEQSFERAKRMKEVTAKITLGRAFPDFFAKDAGRMYAALLAAKREDEASKVATKSFELSDTPELRIELVSSAADAKQFRPQHLKWIETIKPSKEDEGDFLLLRAYLHYNNSDYESALKDYTAVISMGYRKKEAYSLRAQVYDKLGKSKLAEQDRKLAETADAE